MDKNDNIKHRKSLNLLKGSGLFLSLVIYFNISSDKEITGIDWLVITCGAVVFSYALIIKLIKSRVNK